MQNEKEKKRLYDIKYRRLNKEKINQRKREYNKTKAGREVQKRSREKTKLKHLQYCQTNEYRSWKKEYDKIYRAKRKYQEFWECFLIIKEIEKIVKERIPLKYERLKERGYYKNKTITRAYKRHLLYGWNFNY